MASSLTLTLMSSPGKSAWSCCSSVVTPGSTTMSYCWRVSAAPDDQADRAGLLPSMRISRADDHRVGDRGIGDGDARDVEVGRDHGRSTGRHDDPLVLRLVAGGACGAGGAGGCADAGRLHCSVSSAARHTATVVAVLDSRMRSTSSSDGLLTSLGPADRFDGVVFGAGVAAGAGLHRLRRRGRTRERGRRRRRPAAG